ncbi:MAG: hypothetical protein V3W34_19045 [Phycisphaerae bacterium]
MKALNISDWHEAKEIRERIYSDEEVEDIRQELEEYLEDAGGLGLIKHPLITHMGYDAESRDMVTMLGRWLAQKRRGIEQFVADGNWSQVLMLHEKPWRMHALIEYSSWMNDEDYWRELGAIWCGIEDPGTYLDSLPWLFNPGNRRLEKRHLMMNEEERAALDAIVDTMTIYRGCAEGNRIGFSWSIGREVGEWFARRCTLGSRNEPGLLLVGECCRSDVIAHFTRRDEAEIVVNPDDVEIREAVSIMRMPLRRTARLMMSEMGNPVTSARILQFQPQAKWFARSPDGIHGLAHETRVLILSQVLAFMVRDEDLEIDADIVAWAAAVHDTQRWSDGIDPDHGARAADWILNRPDFVPRPVSLDRVAFLCRWHVPPDRRAPEMTPELKVFKDADALDRWRIDDLDPAYLRTKSAKQLLDVSHDFWAATSGSLDMANTFDEIVAVAMAKGLVVDA